VVLGKVGGRTYAFIGLERIGGFMVYEVSNPYAPKFVQYVNGRDFSGDALSGGAIDLAPEGVLFIGERDSPTGKALLVAAHEVSGSTTIYEIR
jgi:2',3'-cyclic-nucleotide 2'-phosphodiesterase/3'-nucleotidase/5'-nucleotidase